MIYQYKLGGSLEYNDPTYVYRAADRDIYEALKAGEFCYVLNSRQMGKSSLQVQTMKLLRDNDGFKCVSIDLTDIGSDVTKYQWYLGIIDSLVRLFGLSKKVNHKEWWQQRNLLSPAQRLSQFIEDVILGEISENIVIFIDEIDSMLKLKFKDDFFAMIRACYNHRVRNPEYKRLRFCLLGVAAPEDLMEDKQRTPFNIGKKIDLQPFTKLEAKRLLTGLGNVENSETILDEIIEKWTGGQPFLTQRLCKIVADSSEIQNFNLKIIVESHIIENWEYKDEQSHLKTIRQRLLFDYENCTGQLLGIYQSILSSGGKIPADNSLEQTRLQLSGLVVKENGHLKVYNRIYQEVFNLNWVQQQLANLRPYQENFQAWIESDKKDDSRLLRAQSLDEALNWKEGKRLSDDDTAFFDASQRYQIETLRQAEAKAKEIIKAAQEGTKIERLGVQALRRFNTKTGQFQALRDAKKAGEDLQKLLGTWENLVKDNSELAAESPAASPLLALQTILSKIRERHTFTSHTNPVMSVSFSSDGKYLATGSADNTAKLWSIETLAEIHTFSGHTNSVTSVSFSSDGKYLATGSADNTAKLWSIETQAEIHTFSGHTHSVWSVSISSDGKYLATGSADNTAKLWSIETPAEIHTFSGHTDWVWSVSFSSDGKYLATGSFDKTAKLWSIETPAEIHTFSGHTDSVWTVSFSSDGKFVATGSADNTAKLWSIKTLAEIHTLIGHTDSVRSVSFSNDGKFVATGSADNTAKLWSMETPAEIHTFIGHNDWVWSVSFSSDGKYLATGSDDKTAKLWSIETLAEIHTLIGHTHSVTSVSISRDGKYLATGSADNTAKLWSMETPAEIHTFIGHTHSVTSVSISSDGKYLATSSDDKTAKLWSIETPAEIHTFSGHTDWVTSVSISSDGKYLATGSDDKTAKLWSIETPAEIHTFSGHTHSVWSVSISSDGKYLATGSADNTAKLWSIETPAEIHTFSGHTDWVKSVSISSDGKYLATGSLDKTAKLWSIETLAEIYTFTGHINWVTSVSFSSDGKYLATGSDDNTAKLWDLSGNLIADFMGYQNWGQFIDIESPVLSVSFTPDGKYLAAGYSDGVVRLWPVENLTQLLARAREWLQLD